MTRSKMGGVVFVVFFFFYFVLLTLNVNFFETCICVRQSNLQNETKKQKKNSPSIYVKKKFDFCYVSDYKDHYW